MNLELLVCVKFVVGRGGVQVHNSQQLSGQKTAKLGNILPVNKDMWKWHMILNHSRMSLIFL